MINKKSLSRIIMIFSGVFITASIWGLDFGVFSKASDSSLLKVTFLDIGQGDSVLIETPDGVQVLIDGGPDGTVLRQLAQTLPWFDTNIDMVIGTHPDKDHIGGLVDVLTKYKVGHLVTTENIGETMVANTYQYALQNEGVPITYARTGQKFLLGSSTLLQVLAPMNNPQMLESNTASIVVQLVYGSTTFMLTGDAPIGIEDYLVKNFGSSLASDVLKLGHHGSKTSTSPLFLDTVSPSFVVVSAGRNNSYGHPHASVVELVNDRGIDLVSTALSGNITFLSDGTRVWIK